MSVEERASLPRAEPRPEPRPRAPLALPFALAALASACGAPPDLTLPTPEQVLGYYESETALDAELSGNVAVIRVQQSAVQLRRGGTLWAKVGPYIYLFTEETRELLSDFPGLAAVRVETRTAGGTEVASALLARDALTGVLWRRSLNIAGRARRDGTERPTLLEELIRWGERHTEFEYDPRYTTRR